MQTEGQYDAVMAVQVLQMGKSGNEKSSSCKRYLYWGQVFSKHYARDLYWVPEYLTHTLNPLLSCSLPWECYPRVVGTGSITGLLHSLASSWVGQWEVLTGDARSRGARRVRSRYLFPWFLDCRVFMGWNRPLILPLICFLWFPRPTQPLKKNAQIDLIC